MKPGDILITSSWRRLQPSGAFRMMFKHITIRVMSLGHLSSQQKTYHRAEKMKIVNEKYVLLEHGDFD